jgi:hypothetical protein
MNRYKLQEWVRILSRGASLSCSGGRPALIGSSDQAVIMALTSVDGVQRRFDEFEDAVHDLLKTKAEQAGKIFKKPSKKTMQAICVKHGIAIKPAETTTDARLMAVRDICNFITFAAMNYAFVVTMKIHPALIVNIDATQFKVGSDSSGAVFVVVSEEDEELLAISRRRP